MNLILPPEMAASRGDTPSIGVWAFLVARRPPGAGVGAGVGVGAGAGIGVGMTRHIGGAFHSLSLSHHLARPFPQNLV